MMRPESVMRVEISADSDAVADQVDQLSRFYLTGLEELSEFLRPKHPKMIAYSDEIERQERLLDIFRQQSAEQLESKQKRYDNADGRRRSNV